MITVCDDVDDTQRHTHPPHHHQHPHRFLINFLSYAGELLVNWNWDLVLLVYKSWCQRASRFCKMMIDGASQWALMMMSPKFIHHDVAGVH